MTNAVAHQSKGLRRDLDITFDRALSYEDGSTKFLGARMVVPQRSGRTFTISAREALQKGEVNSAEKPLDVQMKGQVRLKTSDGFEAHTDEATYSEPESILRAPKAVGVHARAHERRRHRRHLRQAARRALAAGRRHDRREARCQRRRRAQYVGRGGGPRAGTTATCGCRTARISGATTGTSTAPRRWCTSISTEDRIELMELRGGVRIAGGTHAAGGLQDMTADSINLNFTDDGQTLRTRHAVGQGRRFNWPAPPVRRAGASRPTGWSWGSRPMDPS